jgi:hypothetical protein
MRVVYQYGSSRISDGATVGATESGPDRKSHNQMSRKGSRAHAQPVPALFSYYNSSTQCIMTDMATGCDASRRGFAWKGARMLNRKLRNIALVGPFHWKWRHETSPIGLLPGKYAGAHELPEVPLGCSLGRPRPLYHCLALSLVICPLSAILLAPSIITFLTFVVFG